MGALIVLTGEPVTVRLGKTQSIDAGSATVRCQTLLIALDVVGHALSSVKATVFQSGMGGFEMGNSLHE